MTDDDDALVRSIIRTVSAERAVLSCRIGMLKSNDRPHHPAVDAQGRSVGRGGERAAYIDDHVGDFFDGREPLEKRRRAGRLEEFRVERSTVYALLPGQVRDNGLQTLRFRGPRQDRIDSHTRTD